MKQACCNEHNVADTHLGNSLEAGRNNVEKLLKVTLLPVHYARYRRLGDTLATLLKVFANLVVSPVLRSKLPDDIEIFKGQFCGSIRIERVHCE